VTPGRGAVPRVLLVVCDSFGVGAAPDAAEYGDEGSNTLGNCSRAAGGLVAPNLEALGLGCLTDIEGVPAAGGAATAHGKMHERSAGKDTTTGHWEIAGLTLDRPFPTYPDGFPEEVIHAFEQAIGREVLGNRPASGTEIIAELGEENLRSGRPIVYTSADSVFQVACHRKVAKPALLYQWCRVARRLLTGEHTVGRVIARPFDGERGSFARTHERRDFSVPPPVPTLLDRCRAAGVGVYGVGKIRDIFADRGLTEGRYSESNDHGIDLTIRFLGRPDPALVFTNLVEFDTEFGHRNDPKGYASCIERFDRRIPELIESLAGGVMFLTGDHGCDPTTPSTDHSREYVPVLVHGTSGGPRDLGTRAAFADLGATVADLLRVDAEGLAGESFAGDLGF